MIEITPELAKAWLSNNPRNRPMKSEKVAWYKEKMLRGLWEEKGGVPIEVFEDGELINGQHRLAAIKESGLCVKMRVRFRKKA